MKINPNKNCRKCKYFLEINDDNWNIDVIGYYCKKEMYKDYYTCIDNFHWGNGFCNYFDEIKEN